MRHLVEVHGGEVRADSAGEGKGATFRVTLPLGPASSPKAGGTAPISAHDITGVRVLLLDDEEDTREATAAMLEELGAKVRAVPSAAAGRAAVDEFHPQVVLCDVAMPGEDGYQFMRTLRSRTPERGGRIPAVALTALATDQDRERAVQAGCQMHIAKPVDVVRLAAAIAMLAAWKTSETGTTDTPTE